MRLMSLFDGSGGFPLAGSMCGIEPVYASEVEPYPIAVTRSRFPTMKHLGDVSKVHVYDLEPVDIITFGSPCQDMSVAGKRAGIKHEGNGDEETTRSGLFMEAIRIIKEMREATDGVYPRIAIWENVPGAFSSNKGEDFRLVLQEFVRIREPEAVVPPVPSGGWAYHDCWWGFDWSIAYRVFDAQYWGVPQRRRRIYLVADFRGHSAGEILFKREGLRGHSAQSREAREEAAGDAGDGSPTDHCYTLKIRSGCAGGGKGALIQKEKSATLATNNDQYLFQPILLDDQGGQQMAVCKDTAPTLRAQMHGHPPIVSMGFKHRAGAQSGSVGAQMEQAPTLVSTMEPAVVYSIENHPADSRIDIKDDGVVQCLTSRMGTGGGNVPMVLVAYGISSYDSNAMKSPNPHSGIYEAKTARTLDLNGGNPACNQGGIAIVQSLADESGGG